MERSLRILAPQAEVIVAPALTRMYRQGPNQEWDFILYCVARSCQMLNWSYYTLPRCQMLTIAIRPFTNLRGALPPIGTRASFRATQASEHGASEISILGDRHVQRQNTGNAIAINIVVRPLHIFVFRFAAGTAGSNVLTRSASR